MNRPQTKTITVTTSFEGIHRYDKAPKEVAFLRTPHRHVFNVRVEVEVFHDDRDIEFIILKHRIDEAIREEAGFDEHTNTWDLETGSCEMVASRIAEMYLPQFVDKYNQRYIGVTVDEDGQNGATVSLYPVERESEWDDEDNDAVGDFLESLFGSLVNKGTEEVAKEMYKDDSSEYNTKHKGKAEELTNPITLEQYQQLAYKNIQHHYNRKEEILHWAVGLGEEAGESLSVIKHKYYGGHYDVADIVGELGDTLWHIAALCTALGLDMEDVARVNLEKLAFRYPGGQFDYERSERRHEIGQGFKESEWYKATMNNIRNKSNERTNME